MKATDLMIGDWVSSRGKSERVTSVYDGYICTATFQDSHDYYFEPIPITPEILEKNFKEFIPGLNCMYELGGPYVASLEEEGQWVFGLAQLGKDSKRYPLVKIKYVHEFQHALKLCGIDLEIRL